jgi:putative PIN family toxin of toxin-antitoxin system
MIDSNVIVSALYNTASKPARVLRYVCENHSLVLCDHIITECYDVINRKFPQCIADLDNLMAEMRYELVAAPRAGLTMPDPKDSPILNAAIQNEVDIIVSGDGHFLSLEIEHPGMLSPAQYVELYM